MIYSWFLKIHSESTDRDCRSYSKWSPPLPHRKGPSPRTKLGPKCVRTASGVHLEEGADSLTQREKDESIHPSSLRAVPTHRLHLLKGDTLVTYRRTLRVATTNGCLQAVAQLGSLCQVPRNLARALPSQRSKTRSSTSQHRRSCTDTPSHSKATPNPLVRGTSTLEYQLPAVATPSPLLPCVHRQIPRPL